MNARYARLSPEEMRDEEISRRATAKFNALRAAILAGDKPPIKEVRDQIIDYVAAASMSAAMTDRTSATQQWFSKFAQAVMRDNAELEAIAEVEQIEKRTEGLDLAAMLRADISMNPGFRASVAAVLAAQA